VGQCLSMGMYVDVMTRKMGWLRSTTGLCGGLSNSRLEYKGRKKRSGRMLAEEDEFVHCALAIGTTGHLDLSCVCCFGIQQIPSLFFSRTYAETPAPGFSMPGFPAHHRRYWPGSPTRRIGWWKVLVSLPDGVATPSQAMVGRLR